ncbi:unnamed protein product [Microthlaspi erraticum]|uniref:Reverse transcriptase domain-containing protein n=1 Tax=Microthlaspi erraticum TaxID=1685480 RepID=A0A6D2HTJ1_9BRAS|nr:unnamed protein product [Microthlaspi erraticum]
MYGATYVQETTKKVRAVRLNMKEAHDRQKSYADRRIRELKFQVGDRMYLKMVMLKGPNDRGIRSSPFLSLILQVHRSEVVNGYRTQGPDCTLQVMSLRTS